MSDLLGPQQAILISSRADIEQFGKEISKDDIEAVYWHMPVSKEELLYAVTLNNSKHIISLIKLSGVFVVNFIPFDLEKKVHDCNLMHGQHVDKFKELDFIKIEASSVECPCIKEACAYLECQVVQTIEYRDYTLFIAKIINSSTVFDVKRLFHLRNNKYTTTKEV